MNKGEKEWWEVLDKEVRKVIAEMNTKKQQVGVVHGTLYGKEMTLILENTELRIFEN